MTSTTGPSLAKVLRLASARRRIRAFLDQIVDLESAGFPHPDGREALLQLKREVELRQRSLDRLPDKAPEQTVDEVCANTSAFLARYTDILGFILRSTNVRNAFEVHFPLKRLILDVLGPDAKLIMSSEWNFVPFTWPMNLDVLGPFVLVGGPAPESGNVLIIPLAGHEIGHSAWRHAGIKKQIELDLIAAIDTAIANRPHERDRLVADLVRDGHDLSWLHHACLESAVRQLEEIFCDMFALYVFGPSFAFAYEYFLAPGGDNRSLIYPSSLDRVRYLLDGAGQLGFSIDHSLFASWLDSAPRSGIHGDILLFADDAVEAMFPAVRDLAFTVLRTAGIPLCDDDAVTRVCNALAVGVPDGEGATLAEIVTAGWLHLRDKGGLSVDDEQPELAMLNELMLKSVEVSEFRLRVNHA